VAGHFDIIDIPETATDPTTPYVFSLEQQCNRTIYLPTPTNTEAFDDPPPDVPVTPSFIKTYYIQLPRGGISDDISANVELWQAWRRTFGFQKLPVGFGVNFIVGVGRGTQVAISYSTDRQNPEYNMIRFNKWDHIPYPLYVTNPINPKFVIGRDFYTGLDGIFYSEEDKKAFKTNFPQLYYECIHNKSCCC
jgi:hypothetical protein